MRLVWNSIVEGSTLGGQGGSLPGRRQSIYYFKTTDCREVCIKALSRKGAPRLQYRFAGNVQPVVLQCKIRHNYSWSGVTGVGVGKGSSMFPMGDSLHFRRRKLLGVWRVCVICKILRGSERFRDQNFLNICARVKLMFRVQNVRKVTEIF